MICKQTLRVFEGPVINARWFGARGDGEADDHGALQAAVDSAGPGDTVHLPNGTYAVSKAVNASKHLTTIDFEGTLVPHGSHDGPLFGVVGDKDTRPRTESTATTVSYGSNPKIDIKSLRLDGRYRSRGFYGQSVDHFSWSNMFISRTSGYAMKLMMVREADIYNLNLDRVSGEMKNEANLCISGDHASGDATNNIRLWGANIVYPGGRAVEIGYGPESGDENGTVRNISFYGAQIHYVRDQGPSYAPTDDEIRFITLDHCHSIKFVACNLRLGDSSSGALVSIGSESSAAQDTREILFIGCRLSGGGRGAVGIENVRAEDVQVYGSTFQIDVPHSGAVNKAVLSTDVASEDRAGVVTTKAQSFAGDKTFTRRLVSDGRFSLGSPAVQTVEEDTRIEPDRSFIQLRSTSGTELSATPTISSDGVMDGQTLAVVNVGSSPITLQRRDALPSSALEMPGRSMELRPDGGRIDFIWSAELGTWCAG